MKRTLILLPFVLIGCTVPSASLEEGEAVESHSEALTAVNLSEAPTAVKTQMALSFARLRLPPWARTCGDDAPIPTRYLTRMPTCRPIWGAGGIWSAQPVADGQSSSLCEVSWSSFRVPFVFGGPPPKPAAPDYGVLDVHAQSYPLTLAPNDRVIAICGALSAASSSSFTARPVDSSTVVGARLRDMAGCGACAFAVGSDIYAALPNDWASDRVRFTVGAREVEVNAGGSQFVLVRGAARGQTGPIWVDRSNPAASRAGAP